MKFYNREKEPLYGRADSIMKLTPFTTSVLKEIMSDHKADYTKNDLLTLYTFTGGVPKYIEQFMGSWWQGKKNNDQDEIDIIGLYAEEKGAK